jgi:Tfp pilus assembly protein PilW
MITDFSNATAGAAATGASTSGAGAVLVASSNGIPVRRVVIHNGGTAGYYSLSGAAGTYHYIRADQSVNIELANYFPVQVYIQWDGTNDMANVFASIFA